jgi:hypothetical protein
MKGGDMDWGREHRRWKEVRMNESGYRILNHFLGLLRVDSNCDVHLSQIGSSGGVRIEFGGRKVI